MPGERDLQGKLFQIQNQNSEFNVSTSMESFKFLTNNIMHLYPPENWEDYWDFIHQKTVYFCNISLEHFYNFQTFIVSF